MTPIHSRGRCSSERGAAAVELALVLPILVTLVFGIIQFGRGYNAQISVTSAAREAAREIATGGTPAAARLAARSAADTIVAGALTVSVPASCTPGSSVTAVASYPFTYDIPFVGQRALTLTSRGSMRCGG